MTVHVCSFASFSDKNIFGSYPDNFKPDSLNPYPNHEVSKLQAIGPLACWADTEISVGIIHVFRFYPCRLYILFAGALRKILSHRSHALILILFPGQGNNMAGRNAGVRWKETY